MDTTQKYKNQYDKGMKAVWIEQDTMYKIRILAAINGQKLQCEVNRILADYVRENGGDDYEYPVR